MRERVSGREQQRDLGSLERRPHADDHPRMVGIRLINDDENGTVRQWHPASLTPHDARHR